MSRVLGRSSRWISWVPNVAGRLSFRIGGQATKPHRSKYSNTVLRPQGRRYLVAYQKRLQNDSVFRISAITGGRSVYSWFCCLASARDENEAAFTGEIYFFPDKSIWKKEGEQDVRALQDEFYKHQNLSENRSTPGKVARSYLKLRGELRAHSACSCTFKLDRDGVCELSDASMSDSAMETYLPDSEEGREETLKRLTDCSFYFLKDLFHQHQHHNERTDTLIGLQEKNTADDVSWRVRLLYGLYYQIIELKRRKRVERYANSAGILAYVCAFRELSVIRHNSFEELAPQFTDEALKASMNAAQDEQKLVAHAQSQRADSARGRATWFFGLAVSLFGLVFGLSDTRSSAQVPAVLLDISKFLQANLDVVVLGFLVLGFLMAVGWLPPSFTASKTAKEFVRTVQAYSQVGASALIFVSALIVLTLTIYVSRLFL